MKLKLILKQSFRDFTSKSVLYLTFTLFLIIAISIFVGLISFGYGFQNLFLTTVGHKGPNSMLSFHRTFLPAWINKSEDRDSFYQIQEKELPDNPQRGVITQFLNAVFPVTDEAEFQRLSLGIGHNQGYVTALYRSDVFDDAVLYDYFQQGSGLGTNLTNYNQQVNQIFKIINNKYQTNNLVAAYFMETELKNSPENSIGYWRTTWTQDFKVLNQNFEKARWFYLRVSDDIIDQTFYDETPWTLRTNQSATIKFWNQVDWNNYKTVRANYNFVYVQPSFLHDRHLKIGDYLTFEIQNLDKFEPLSESDQRQEFLIAGTATDAINFYYHDVRPDFMIPYQWMDRFYQAHGKIATPPPVIEEDLSFYFPRFGSNLKAAQEFIGTKFNNTFANLINPDELLEMSTDWTDSLPAYTYDLTVQIFLVMGYIVGFIVLLLLAVVFYFITQQVVAMQRRILFFLKSLGVYDSGLSFLTTAALFVPIFIGLIGGFFGALLIQKAMYSVALIETAFYMPYFSFNYEFWIALFLTCVVIWLLFYVINILLIKSKRFRMNSYNIGKKPVTLLKKLKYYITKNASPKFQIGFSFAFKNIYKNLIVFLTLSLSFGVILYAVQFKVSMATLSRTYENWNTPYKSVNFANGLTLFSEEKGTDEYLRSYDTFLKNQAFDSADVEGNPPTNGINNEAELSNVIQLYFASLNNPNSSFRWQNYYVTKEFTYFYLKQMIDPVNGENMKQQFIQKILDLIEQFSGSPPSRETAQMITNLIDETLDKYLDLHENLGYDDGFNIYFGKTPLHTQWRSVFSFNSRYLKEEKNLTMLAYEIGDSDTANHFNFKDIKDENWLIHSSWNNQPTTFLRVNISSKLANTYNLKTNNVLKMRLNGFKTAENPTNGLIYLLVDQIVKEETLYSMIYTSQFGLINYFADPNHLPANDLKNIPEIDLNLQKEVYENLANEIENNTKAISNTVYDRNNKVPWGMQNITLPFYSQNAQFLGQRAEDLYSSTLSLPYLTDLGDNIVVFEKVSRELSNSMWQVNTILNEFVIILLLLAFILSLILITLVLLENRPIILLFKAMGYRKSELNWYLISGYFVASFLATAMGILISYIGLKKTQGIISEYLQMSLYFVWSWEFILISFALAIGFCLLIGISVVVFTTLQKPREAFMVL